MNLIESIRAENLDLQRKLSESERANEKLKDQLKEIEDAMGEGIPIYDNHVPKKFIIRDQKLAGMEFEKVEAVFDENGKRSLVPTGEDPIIFECDDVLVAIGQDNAFEWIEQF